jgi:hypothetical protein
MSNSFQRVTANLTATASNTGVRYEHRRTDKPNDFVRDERLQTGFFPPLFAGAARA